MKPAFNHYFVFYLINIVTRAKIQLPSIKLKNKQTERTDEELQNRKMTLKLSKKLKGKMETTNCK